MRFRVALDRQPEGGFTAQCIEVPGAITQGETEEEALENVQEAILLLFASRRDQAVLRDARIRIVKVDVAATSDPGPFR